MCLLEPKSKDNKSGFLSASGSLKHLLKHLNDFDCTCAVLQVLTNTQDEETAWYVKISWCARKPFKVGVAKTRKGKWIGMEKPKTMTCIRVFVQLNRLFSLKFGIRSQFDAQMGNIIYLLTVYIKFSLGFIYPTMHVGIFHCYCLFCFVVSIIHL